jgi:hypothetical protein
VLSANRDTAAGGTAEAREDSPTAAAASSPEQANRAAEDPRPGRAVRPADEAARLTEAELRQLEQLKARDREVRAHEQAHIAAGGSLVRGGASYTYQQGPDGRRYAVAGEVHIDTAPVAGDPEQTARQAEQVRRAALAPGSPSAQDRAVAARAAATATRARAEVAQQRLEEMQELQDTQETASTADPLPPRGQIDAYREVAGFAHESTYRGDSAVG